MRQRDQVDVTDSATASRKWRHTRNYDTAVVTKSAGPQNYGRFTAFCTRQDVSRCRAAISLSPTVYRCVNNAGHITTRLDVVGGPTTATRLRTHLHNERSVIRARLAACIPSQSDSRIDASDVNTSCCRREDQIVGNWFLMDTSIEALLPFV